MIDIEVIIHYTCCVLCLKRYETQITFRSHIFRKQRPELAEHRGIYIFVCLHMCHFWIGGIFMVKMMWSFVHDPLTDIGGEETCQNIQSLIGMLPLRKKFINKQI